MCLYLPSTHSLVAVLDDKHLNYAVNIVNENDSLIKERQLNETVSLLYLHFKRHSKLFSE
jgi:hypothetical protein